MSPGDVLCFPYTYMHATQFLTDHPSVSSGYSLLTQQSLVNILPWWNNQVFHGQGWSIKTQNKILSLMESSEAAPLPPLSPSTPLSPAAKRQRSMEWRELSPSGRKYRVDDAIEVLMDLGVPHTAVAPVVHLSRYDMIGYPKPIRMATKKIMKQTNGKVVTPCERSVRAERVRAASANATITHVFSCAVDSNTTIAGGYADDPVGLLSNIVQHSKYLCVGGDKGGGVTKLGVTHTDGSGVTSFLPLLMYDSDERYECLSALNHAGKEYSGATKDKGLKTIWQVLQWLIDEHGAFLNGDMKFICTVLGHSG